MTDLISNMLDLIRERSAITNSNEKNVFLTQVDNKIRLQKQLIIDHATNSINTSNITLNDLDNKVAKLRRRYLKTSKAGNEYVQYAA